MLNDKFLKGIAADSRVGRHQENWAINEDAVMLEMIKKVQELNNIAASRNQLLAQIAIAWVIKDKRITAVIPGAIKPEQITDSLKAIDNYYFSRDELSSIENILKY
ncbi:MAG: aldo/keto reductase [Ferruginibacter sp.]